MNQSIIRGIDFKALQTDFSQAMPFNHLVIDDFLSPDMAAAIAAEFPPFESADWHVYDNALEVKKTLNNYNLFKPATYSLFTYLNSADFIAQIEPLVGERLYPDIGLNGGGLHTHARGGKLNTHLDYSLHPKLNMERRLNLLVYVTPNWNAAWGGSLGLWSQHATEEKPDTLVKTIECVFNRAVLFDTTQRSWHGLPEPIRCPEGVTRNSLAAYYLCQPRMEVSRRGKALFAPYGDQKNDASVLELIQKRAFTATAHEVYKAKN